ncbi:MAG: lysophospholipid acyltransferase family protein [Myxococcales bacterium]
MRDWTFAMEPEAQEKLSRLAAAQNEFGVDPFGLNLDFTVAALAPMVWLYKHYFRVEATGAERLPEGRLLLIANHSGQLPLDGAMIGVACFLQGEPPRAIRAMVEKWVPSLPFVSTFMARAGQVVGTPENCRRLLAAGETILVFPEGVRGISKLYKNRYQLQEFGQGFMRLALETDTPIVPVAVIGAEEQAAALVNVKPVADLLGFPAFPITPTVLPFPLPTKYRIGFGQPMRFTGRPDDDEDELERKVRSIKAELQSMINAGVQARKHVFW